jgi:hypothetical protein
VLLLAALAGCGTTRVSDSQRTATEQLLISNAVDQAVSEIDLRPLAGKPVFLDAQFLKGTVDEGYVVSSLRQHLLASGALLQEDRSKATYILEARSGAVGTDRHDVLFGVPEMHLPSVMPGQPSLIPEIPLAKKIDQKGVAKLAVFAYNRLTGRPLLQSGIVMRNSTSNDMWLLGTGPFRRGTINDRTEFAGERIAIPFLVDGDNRQDHAGQGVGVVQAATWQEPPLPSLSEAIKAGYIRLLPPPEARK